MGNTNLALDLFRNSIRPLKLPFLASLSTNFSIKANFERSLLIFFLFFWIAGEINGEALWKGNAITLHNNQGCLSLSHHTLKSLSSFSDEEFLEFEKSAAKLENVFQRVFGIGDYFRVLPLDSPAAEMAIYPVGAYDNSPKMSLAWLVRNTLVAVHDEKALIPPLDRSTLEKIATAAHEILNPDYLVTCIPLPEGKNEWIDIQEAFDELRNEWNKRSSPQDQLLGGAPLATTFSTERKMTCSFLCNQEQLQAQTVFTTPHHTILVNYRPYTKEEHLLIAPKRHIEKLAALTDEEIVEKYHLVLRLHHALRDLFPDPALKITLLTKGGWKGNQTEPHLHDHLIVGNPHENQPWMSRLLLYMQSGQRPPPLTAEEIDCHRQRLLLFLKMSGS